MCGIGVTVGCSDGDSLLHNVLKQRGPDQQQIVQLSPTIAIQATVLHMRGSVLTPQPVKLKSGLFCWNGEVYQMLNEDDKLQDLTNAEETTSDTEILSSLLDEALRKTLNQEGNDDCCMLQAIQSVMSRVWNGEYAFCIVTEQNVYYGRDKWGRRSLLVSNDSSAWRLSSVATGSLQQHWTEVPPGCVFQYNMTTKTTSTLPLSPPTLHVIPNLPPSTPPPSNVSQGMWQSSIQLQQLLTLAVQRRCCSYRKEGVGILFSGGLDSVVLTALAAQVMPPDLALDLLNVSFGDKSADLQAALQSHAELQQLYPDRTFRLVGIQADWNEIVEQHERMERLMHPKSTTMDLNISTALWFAARGRGTLANGDMYHSSCRILLLGMGADEQMAGYGRHRKHADRLREELDMDLGRLWERNLGRDDRVVSDHGKEARFPYLDTNVVHFLSAIPLEHVCDFSREPGIGDKQILRLIAQRLGLKTASELVKRAIQFGSRIAHVSDKERFGSRRKATGESHYKDSTKK